MIMAYVLRAFISKPEALQSIVENYPQSAVVALDQGMALLPLPLTREVKRMVKDKAQPQPDPFPELFYYLLAPIAEHAAQASVFAATAYFEAEIFGGAGEQSVIVWEAGKIVFGPLKLDDDRESDREQQKKSGTAFSQALRWMGVDKGSHHDEFAAVGLGRYRRTDEWLGASGND
jgi:hypothetical protein